LLQMCFSPPDLKPLSLALMRGWKNQNQSFQSQGRGSDSLRAHFLGAQSPRRSPDLSAPDVRNASTLWALGPIVGPIVGARSAAAS
jgi:hypothetical protein